MKVGKAYKTIDEYISFAPKSAQSGLRKIRLLIRKSAPGAIEVISYQMPAFKIHGRMLVYFAAWKGHIGFYPPAPKALRKETLKYEGPKGNLKFPIDKPLPVTLIKKIVQYRAKANLALVKKK